MDIDGLRSEMPFLNRCLYFNTGGIAPSTSVVTDTLINYFTDVRRQGPPLIMDSVANSERMADARQRIAALLRVDEDDLCLTRGVTDGITLVLNGFDWEEGDEMIITDEEHPAVQMPADRLVAACGVTLKRLALSDNPEAMLQRLRKLLTPRTRLLTLSHVTTDTGTRLPAEEICQMAHAHEIPVMLDGAQALGQFPVDIPALDADFYSFLNYKWLFGPYSTGGLYIKKIWQERLKLVATGRSVRRINPSSYTYPSPGGAKQFETGALSQSLYYATAAAIDYIQAIGISAIEDRTRQLTADLRAALKAIPGLSIESPETAETSTGIVTFTVKGIDGRDLNAGLRARNVVGRAALMKFSGVRISVAFFNTEEELDVLVRAITEIVGRDGA